MRKSCTEPESCTAVDRATNAGRTRQQPVAVGDVVRLVCCSLHGLPCLHDSWPTSFYQIGNPKVGGLTKSGRLSHIITPGVHRVEVTVACGAPHTSQQSCTSSTHQLENAACASLQPRLTCCQTFILPLSALRNWLGKMTAAAEVSSNAGGSMGEISRRFRLHMGDTALGI